jgi:hypothetical protein
MSSQLVSEYGLGLEEKQEQSREMGRTAMEVGAIQCHVIAAYIEVTGCSPCREAPAPSEDDVIVSPSYICAHRAPWSVR